MNWHRTQATILVDAGVEMLAFETFPAQKEAEAVVQLLRELPSCKAWISFSCKVGQISHRFIPCLKSYKGFCYGDCLRQGVWPIKVPYKAFKVQLMKPYEPENSHLMACVL